MIKWSQKTIKNLVGMILHATGDPRDTALAVAFGIFIAWFPIIGTHTAMAIGGALLLRLNPALVLAGSLVNNPFTAVFVYLSGFYVGFVITGTSMEGLTFNADLDTVLGLGKAFIIPFLVGNLLLGILGATVSYFVTLRAVKRYRAGKAEGMAKDFGLEKD